MATVMIVDDEQDIRDSVKTILEKEGYDVITAVSGDDALEKINGGKKPDLVLMDIMMPGVPVKAIVPKLGVNVVYLSVVKLSDMERKNLMGKNVKGYIEKPFDIKSLIRDVKKYLG